MNFLLRVLTNNQRFSAGHPEYRRAYLLNVVLVGVVSKILCKPPSSGKIEITDDGGFNYVKKRKQQTEGTDCRIRY